MSEVKYVKFDWSHSEKLRNCKVRLSVEGGYISITKRALKKFLEQYNGKTDVYVGMQEWSTGENVAYIYILEHGEQFV